jgi:hypothetical protein
MPTTYKLQSGSRSYADYTTAQLAECLEAVQSGQMSQRRASAHLKFCRSTIKNKFKKQFTGKPGHPNVFTEEEEKDFDSHIHNISEYGFPADELDLRFIVKAFLTRQGRILNHLKKTFLAVTG